MLRNATPIQIIISGYLILTIGGALLLCLPISSANLTWTSFVDTVFTAASAISTTGLAVVDTGSYYSFFGQNVIMLLIQIGGLGYMVFIAVIYFGIGAKFSLNGNRLFAESISRPSNIEIKKFVKTVILFTFVFEFVGAFVLTLVFIKRFTFWTSVYSAVFHSISAFCTAGFSLYTDSFVSYSGSITINVIIAVITIAGGIGFFVLYDLWKFFINSVKRNYPIKLSDHTKLVLVVSFLLMASGTIILFYLERAQNGPSSLSERILESSFQSISASSTTGFNTVDIGTMHQLSLYCLIILMFIGASPGSTGGGIKTSTFGIIFLFLKKIILNRQKVSAFHRTVSEDTVDKAIGLTMIWIIYVVVAVFVLSMIENFSLLQIFFEVVSALGTVGLSMGITPSLGVAGKLLITITMLVGRVGPLAIGYSLVGRVKYQKHTYPLGNIMAG